jgi:hypothetical protein
MLRKLDLFPASGELVGDTYSVWSDRKRSPQSLGPNLIAILRYERETIFVPEDDVSSFLQNVHNFQTDNVVSLLRKQ